MGPRDGLDAGIKEIDRREYRSCAQRVPGDTFANLQVSTRLSGVSWKHVLLPVWIAAYRYRGKPYRFLVNGQTGKVSGDAPYSWIKVGILIACIAALLWILFRNAEGSPDLQRWRGVVPSVRQTVHERVGAGSSRWKFVVGTRCSTGLSGREVVREAVASEIHTS